jgi:hypothetical protein
MSHPQKRCTQINLMKDTLADFACILMIWMTYVDN